MKTTPRQNAARALRNFPRTLAELTAHPDFRHFGDTSDDWINDPERMERCHAAAEDGEDGSTHAERLDDMRENLDNIRRDLRHQFSARTEDTLDAWTDKLHAEIDACEEHHELTA